MRVDRKKDFKKKFQLCATLLEVDEPLKIILDESFVNCCINFKIAIKDELSKLIQRKFILVTTSCVATRTKKINDETSYAIKKMVRYKCPHDKEKNLRTSINNFLKQMYCHNNYTNINNYFANGLRATHNFDNRYNFKDPLVNQIKDVQTETSEETEEKKKKKEKKEKKQKKRKKKNREQEREEKDAQVNGEIEKTKEEGTVNEVICEKVEQNDQKNEKEDKTKEKKDQRIKKRKRDKVGDKIKPMKNEQEDREEIMPSKKEEEEEEEKNERAAKQGNKITNLVKIENVSNTEKAEQMEGVEEKKKKKKKKKEKKNDGTEDIIQLSASAKCIIDLVKNNNEKKFFIGTNNLELRSMLRKIFLVPILYINECGILKMEHMSTKNENKKAVVERRKMKIPQWERDLRMLQRKKEENESQNRSSRKKKTKKNMLNSIKKTQKDIDKKKKKKH